MQPKSNAKQHDPTGRILIRSRRQQEGGTTPSQYKVSQTVSVELLRQGEHVSALPSNSTLLKTFPCSLRGHGKQTVEVADTTSAPKHSEVSRQGKPLHFDFLLLLCRSLGRMSNHMQRQTRAAKEQCEATRPNRKNTNPKQAAAGRRHNSFPI